MSDRVGGFDRQSFVVAVAVPNDPPSITSKPGNQVTLGDTYFYEVTAIDPDGDALSFSLDSAPAGMLISPAGSISWSPTAAQLGVHQVSVLVADIWGATDRQHYGVAVVSSSAQAPVIVSAALAEASESQPYFYDVQAVDPNDDPLDYSLSVAPSGMGIDGFSGAIDWLPSTDYETTLAGENSTCLMFSPQQIDKINLVVKWHWLPTVAWKSNRVDAPAMVAPLYDTNGDGVVTTDDKAYVVFTSYEGNFANGYLRVVDGDTGEEVWQVGSEVTGISVSNLPLAIADLDGNGFPEIVVRVNDGKFGYGIFSHDGQWLNPDLLSAFSWSPTLADVNRDGDADIVALSGVFSPDGSAQLRTGDSRSVPSSVVADIDLDGRNEIINGQKVFSDSGSLLWEIIDAKADFKTAAVALGNFDDDPEAEIVLVANEHLDFRFEGSPMYLLEHDGRVIWRLPRRTPRTGPPSIGDLDGDGRPEIVVIGTGSLEVFEQNGSLKWRQSINDDNSTNTGVTLFDFQGDGKAEVLYQGAFYFHIFDGSTGEVLFRTENGSHTGLEYPVIADLDGDHHAEILVGANDRQLGLRAFESATDDWVGTRKVWNQYSYSIDNINDDLSVPAAPIPSWLSHNSFRQAAYLDRHPLGEPDLAVLNLKLDGESGQVALTITNRGLAPTDVEAMVTLYHGDPASGNVLASQTVPDMAVGESRDLLLPIANVGALNQDLYAVIDSDHAVAECLEDNNLLRAALVRVDATDPGSLSDQQTFAITVENINETPVIFSTPVTTAQIGANYGYHVLATDPDLGDGLRFELNQAPVGMTVDSFAGLIQWVPAEETLGAHQVVVRVTDLGGLSASQSFDLLVDGSVANNFPVISTTPTPTAVARQIYEYDVDATDVDGDTLEYVLSKAPTGMIIDSASGEIVWQPYALHVGTRNVRIDVLDHRGGMTTQRFSIEVLPAGSNQPPIITSIPPAGVRALAPFVYDVDATDPDGDRVSYRLESAPAGMTLDAVSGLIEWTPAIDQLGEFVFNVFAEDGLGGSAGQQITVTIEAANNSPVIGSVPVLDAAIGQAYQYAVTATDADGDTISFALDLAPTGVTIDASSGLVNWIPATDQFGAHPVIVRAVDQFGGVGTQSFEINVIDPNNSEPSITSTPPVTALVSQAYAYPVVASDPNGDTLSFALSVAPVGMVIDSVSGQINWVPTAEQIGDHPVTVTVGDGRGGLVGQSFTIAVADSANGTPQINSAPSNFGKASFEYSYQINATDPDGDTLNYSLTQGPAGMSLDSLGVLLWTPAVTGFADVSVRVDDGLAFVEQAWSIEVLAADTPLTIDASVDPNRIEMGGSVLISIGAAGMAGDFEITARLDGQPLALDQNYQATITPDVLGEHVLTAAVADAYDTASASTSFLVFDPSLGDPPVVTLIEPTFEQEVSAPTDIIGTVADDDLVRWFVGYLERGRPSNEFVQLAEGVTPVTEAVLAPFDPTVLQNGLYEIILQAEDTGGNISVDQRVVRVTGNLKVGNFSITFEEVTVPVSGIPITVTRTYDSRQRNKQLDFGYGWSVDYQNVRVQESRTPGRSWDIFEYRSGLLTNFCVQPNGDPLVTVTLPDGEVETFKAKASPECQLGSPGVSVDLVFEPVDGTDSTLEQTDYGLVQLLNGNIADPGAPDVPVDPQHYRLSTPEGFVYVLNQGFTIDQVIDPNGNTLSFTDNGILHSSGKGIDFVRDTQGRITDLVLPDAQVISYGYDANGDLETVTDQVLNVTSFTYLAPIPHYLEDIIDPRGIRVARNEYADDGRLIAHIDADGHRIEYTHDIAGRSESIKDRRGNTSLYLYDDEGNVLAETNALSETTLHSYDADRNETSRTDALGNTTAWTYDARGNQLTETDPLGRITSSAYSDRNQLTSQTDPAGIVVLENGYDFRTGNLLSSKDALGNTTAFVYDSGIGTGETGNLLGITDAQSNTTSYLYDESGNRLQEVDVRGTLTEFTYDAMGRQQTQTTTRTDENGVVITLTSSFEYDDKGRLIRSIDPEGGISSTEYNEIDKEIAVIDPLGNRTEFEYDARGNRYLTRYPDLSTETTGYDEAGNVTSQTDRAGRTTRMIYDAANRLLETVYPDATPLDDLDNPRTRNEYDAAGRLEATVDELNHRTTYGYDDAGRRTTVTDALLNVTTFEYDLRGNRTATIDALNHRTEFVYDEAGRLLETWFADASSTTTTYDDLGRKLSETDQAGKITRFEYDPGGNLTAVVDALSQRTEYEYDEQSNKIIQRDAEGRETKWTYDDAGRVVSRILPLGQTETFVYDLAGNRDSSTDFNGVATHYQYDEQNRQTRIDYPDSTFVVTAYTLTGQVQSVTDHRGATGYTYDERERLTQISYPNGETIEYAYDVGGNRIGLDTGNQSVAYTFDDLNRLATVSDAAGITLYRYDAVGNRAGIEYANGARAEYVYDDLNRLSELSNFGSG